VTPSMVMVEYLSTQQELHMGDGLSWVTFP